MAAQGDLPELVDIAFNLTDESFQRRGDSDLVLERAVAVGVRRLVVCAGSVADSVHTLELCEQLDPGRERLFVTVGVHPTRCNEFLLVKEGKEPPEGEYPTEIEDPDSPASMAHAEAQLEKLFQLVAQDSHADAHGNGRPPRIVGFGEFGLDYERLHFCAKETQLRFFARQLELVTRVRREVRPGFPMFLHVRGEGCCADLLGLLGQLPSASDRALGVAHSFDGTKEEAAALLEAGLELGINGCGLKTEENCAVVRGLPLDRLHLETDAPYCDVRPSHHSHAVLKQDAVVSQALAAKLATLAPASKKFERGRPMKGRNEPYRTWEVAAVVAALKGVSIDEVARAASANSRKMFGL